MATVTTLSYPFPYSGKSSTTTSAKTTYTSGFMSGAWLYNTYGSIPIYNSISDLNANQYKYNNSLNYSSSWATSTAPATSPNWYSVAMSSNGQYAVACDGKVNGLLWYSTNYGIKWIQSFTTFQVNRTWTSVAMSESGKYAIACDYTNGKIWYSSDYAVNWNESATVFSGANWWNVCLSRTGQYGIACDFATNRKIWYSSDYGQTWTATTTTFPTTVTWRGCSISGTGQYAIACDVNNGGKVWYSSNYGQTWTQSTINATTNSKFRSVAMSDTGKYGIAVDNGWAGVLGYIWYSSDYGQTWTASTGTNNAQWTNASITYNGNFAIVCDITAGGKLWYSNDFGVTWTAYSFGPTNSIWRGCAVSPLGNYALAADNTTSNNIWYVNFNAGVGIRVLPGYKVIYYTYNNFGGADATIDSTDNAYGINTYVSTIVSLRIYYQGIELKNNNVPINIPYSITNSNSSNMLDKTGLLYYYPFDTDTVNYSSALNGNNYELSSATLSTSTTKLTSGSLAIGLGGHFKVPGHKINPSLGYSVALWYKLGTTTGGWSRIIELSQKINAPSDILLGYPIVGSGKLYFSSYGGGIGDVNANYTMDTNWHHVCVTCSIKGYWTVYIDGVELSMAIRNNTPLPDYLNYWYINKSSYTVDGNASCNVNQLLIFNREIKPYEVYYLYQNPTTVQLGYMQSQISNTSLQYYYPLNNNFNDITNSTFTEGGIDNGIYTGMTALDTTTTKMTTSSLKITSSSSAFFQVPSHYITTNYSISFWVKLNAVSSGPWSRLIDFSSAKNGTAPGGPILYFKDANSGSLGFSPGAGAPNNDNRYTMDFNWHHMCVTYSSLNSTWTLYIDGTSNFTTVHNATVNLLNYCYIGKSNWVDGSLLTNFNVNQLAVFSKTLTLTEIQTLYNNPTQPITLSNLMYYYPFNTDFYDYSKTTYTNVGTDNSTHTNVIINRGEGTNNGVYTGITALDTTTKKMTTSSIKIDGSTGFFQVPSHYITPNYSIAFWYKLNSYSSVFTNSRIIEFTPGTDLSGSIILYYGTANSGSLSIVVNRNNDSFLSANYTLDLNWHHICLTYSSGSWILYIDGVSCFTRTFTAYTGLLNYCYIGKTTNISVANTVCNVNQLAIFSKTLTIDEVTDLTNNPIQPIIISNLMYYYPFDTDFNDYSQTQMSNRSANINSSVGWIQVPAHSINPTGYSISMWYKLNQYSSSGTGSYPRLIEFTPLSNLTGSILIYYTTYNSGALGITLNGNNDGINSANYTLDLNWHHICLTYSSGSWILYIDGSACFTRTITATTSVLNYCYIGKSTVSGIPDTNCNVKQLAIYQRQLSVDEIRFLYDNPNCPINKSSITTSTLTNYYPCFPGCYLYVNNKTAIPLYASISNQNWCFDQDSAWWVLPGYKIIVYSDSNYQGTSFIVDNTYGFNNMCKMSDNPNTVNSIKLYYKGQEIIHGEIFNTINYTLNNSIPSSIPFKYLCNNNLDTAVTNNSQSSFPGAWIITGSGSYPIYETINNLSAIGANASGTAYDVLPGFKLVIYTSTNLNGTATSYWNDGYSLYRVYAPTSTVINSVALYFHGQPIVKKRYSDPSNINFAISTRLVVPSYTGPIMNIRRSSDSVTQDFYSDAQQTYLTTGPNNTGQTYLSWIFSTTGYITKMYDQSGKSNHCANTTNSAQPALSLYNGKYVMQYSRANSTCLNITTPCQPNTIFSHFYNIDVSAATPGDNIYSIITTPIDYQLRFVVPGTNSYGNFAYVGGADWYVYSTGNKNAYVNNYPSTISGFNWNIIALSVENNNMTQSFNRVGTDGNNATRGLNGYMTEMICHNTEMSALDMQQYYADQLILTQYALESTRTTTNYSLNTTYYPSQVKGIWNDLTTPSKINISFTYTFNYTGSTNTGTFYVAVDDFAWIFINGGAPTFAPYENWNLNNNKGVTGAMPIINGLNTIEIIAYNYNPNNPNVLSGPAALFGAFYDSNNNLIAYTSKEWKTQIVNTVNQTSVFASPIVGGLWVTTYSFTENEGYYNGAQANTIQTPNYYSYIQKLKPVSTQVVSTFSGTSTINPLVNGNTTTWGFKAVGYFVPNSTGTWTFTMVADDVAQIWIGVSATNPTTINQLTTPNLTCFNETKTFTVSVTANVQYPILIYMGNGLSKNGINPNGFALSVTNPSSVSVALSTVFYYLNCPPIDGTPASTYFYDGTQRSVYAGANYATASFGFGNTTDFPSQSLCIWSEPNFRGVPYPAGPYVLFTYTFNYTGLANTGTYKIIVDDIAYLYFNGSAPNRCDWAGTCSGTIPLINGTNYIQAIAYNTGGGVGFLASFFDSSNNLVAYTDGSWKYQFLSPITPSASPIHLPVQGGLWTRVYSYNAAYTVNSAYYAGSTTTITDAGYYYTNLDTLNAALISSKIISNFNISTFSSTNQIYTEPTGNIAWGFKASGFFVPDVTGSWTFTLSADDCAELWIGSDATGNIISICPSSTSTTTNANIRVLYTSGNGTYSVTLVSGRYYPILLYYGEGVGGQSISFTYKPTASALAQTVDKYLYYVNAAPIY